MQDRRRHLDQVAEYTPTTSPPGPTGVDILPLERLPIADLHLGDGPRSNGQDAEHVARLAEAESDLPPIIVSRQGLRVIDGNHRVRAALVRGADHIWARMFDGDSSAAFVLAVTANVVHGLPLSLADRKSAAARIVVLHPEWSDRSIATATGLAARTVARIRERSPDDPTADRSRVGRDGRIRPLDRLSRRQAAVDLLRRHPDASLRSVAAEVGLSPETVRDVRLRLQRGVDPLNRRPPTVGRSDAGPAAPVAPVAQAELRPANPGHAARPHGTDQVATEALLQRLRTDPALRYTQAGRGLLRLLDTHRLTERSWRNLLVAIPPHTADAVAAVADAYAQSWQRFAHDVRRRHLATAREAG